MKTFYAAPVFFLAVLAYTQVLKFPRKKSLTLPLKKILLTHGLHLNMPRGLIVLFNVE